MNRGLIVTATVMVSLIGLAGCKAPRLGKFRARHPEARRISVDEYVDKMKAGWIGQMAGVGWGGPTEFRYKGVIIPQDDVPQWRPELINQFRQDDIYVEMTFLRTLELHGFDVSIRQAGIDFANSGYPLWHANRAGRDNLRSGIAPPDSGHPEFNEHADDIDYQIEADYAGLIAPGMPNVAIQLGETFGRLMNYGDGLYGGQFVGGMYAEAFFEDDVVQIVEAGLRCIPEDSQYHECISDVLAWYEEYPDDWAKTWQRWARPVLAGTLALMVALGLALNVPSRMGEAHSFYGITRSQLQPIEAADVHNALVIVYAERWLEYGAMIAGMSPTLDDDVVYARGHSAEIDAEVIADYPGRAVYYLTDGQLSPVPPGP